VVTMALAFISIFQLAVCCGVSCCQGLHYCSRHGAEQFPVHSGQQLLLQFMRVPLHVVVVLLCLVSGVS